MRSIPIALAALVALAGCISIPETEGGAFEPTSSAPFDRIEGMTAEETKADAAVPCNDGGLQLPPRACAERTLTVTGRIGVDRLPVDLEAQNGAIRIEAVDGDAWSFEATVRVAALTEEDARRALDIAWSWSHEEGGQHVLRAGPTPMASGVEIGTSPHVVAATYTVRLPAWIVLDLDAETDNGQILVDGFEMATVDVETSNGGISLRGAVATLDAQTSNGEIELDLVPRGGAFDLATSNGRIELELPDERVYGYAIAAETTNGRIEIDLPDGEVEGEEDEKTFRTRGFASRDVRTSITAETTNGAIRITS